MRCSIATQKIYSFNKTDRVEHNNEYIIKHRIQIYTQYVYTVRVYTFNELSLLFLWSYVTQIFEILYVGIQISGTLFIDIKFFIRQSSVPGY